MSTHTMIEVFEPKVMAIFLALAMSTGVAAAGCGGDPLDDGTGGGPGVADEPVAQVAEALDSSWATGPFTWDQGHSDVRMMSATTHVCVLTTVRGEFDGGGEWIRSEVLSDNYWYLRGDSQASGVRAQAFCFDKSKFLANGDARWISDAFYASDNTSGCNGGWTNTWWGDAATFLSGVQGEFDGSGERGAITQSTTPFSSSALRAESCAGWLRASGHSFFAGTPHSGQTAKFWGGERTVSVSKGTDEVQLAPTGDAMCYLTRVEGYFNGSGEHVVIYPKYVNGLEYWYLKATHSTTDAVGQWVSGRARCYRRDQR